MLEVGALRAAPGTKVTGFLEVPGTPIAMPVTVVRGAAPGPVLSVTAGVHGGEYPGIEAAIQTARALDPAGILHGCPALAEALDRAAQLHDPAVGRHGDLGGIGNPRIEFWIRFVL